jgi:hypothetical protein
LTPIPPVISTFIVKTRGFFLFFYPVLGLIV